MCINTKKLVVFQLFYTIFIIQWIYSFQTSSLIPLVADGINVLLILLIGREPKENNPREIILLKNTLIVVLLILIFIGSFQFVDNGVIKGSMLLFWSIRLFYRPFLLFFSIYNCFDIIDVEIIDKALEPLAFIHCGISAFQYYVLGIKWDNNGGIFGTASGCNGYVNIFWCILVAYYLVKYFSNKVSWLKTVFILISACMCGYWSELKFLYLEIIIILILALLICKKSVKGVLFVLILSICIVNILPVIANLLPDNFQQMLNIDSLISYSQTAYNESGRGYISRGSGLEVIKDSIFKNNWFKTLFGLGLGGANQISFLGIESLGYYSQGWRHYDYFSIMYLFTETGIVGILFFGIIFINFFRGFRTVEKVEYRYFGYLMIAIVLINFWYNSSWTTDGTSYLLMLFMALPYIYNKKYSKSKGSDLV